MTQDEKRLFINDLCHGIRAFILSKVERMPEKWDGHQLRRYIKEVFAEQSVFRPMSKRAVYLYNIVRRENNI